MKLKILSIVLSLSACHFALATTPSTPLDRIAVIVNDQVITQSQLAHQAALYQRELTAENKALPNQKRLQQQVLKRFINHSLQLQMAKRADVQVNAEQVNDAVNSVAKQNNMTLAQLRQSVLHNGLTFKEYRENIHDQLVISELQRHAIASKITVSPQEVTHFLQAHPSDEEKNKEFRLKHILVRLSDKPTPQQIAQARTLAKKLMGEMAHGATFDQIALTHTMDEGEIDSGDLGWRKLAELPSLFVNPVKPMKKGEIKGPIKAANGFHILQLDDLRQNRFQHQTQQVHLRQIVLKTEAINNKAQVKEHLKTLKKQIQQGTPFSVLAKQYSIDTFSKAQGGDMGWLNVEALPLTLQTTLTTLKNKEISAPLFIQDRWYLIQKLGTRTTEDSKEFRRSQVKQLLFKQKYETELKAWLEQLKNSAYIKIVA